MDDQLIPQPLAGLLLAFLCEFMLYGAWCLLTDDDAKEEGPCEVPDD